MREGGAKSLQPFDGLNYADTVLRPQPVHSCSCALRHINSAKHTQTRRTGAHHLRDKQDGEKLVEQYWGNRKPIVNEGTLPNGKGYASFAEFKSLIVEQAPRFERGLAEKLMIYALGRPLEESRAR